MCQAGRCWDPGLSSTWACLLGKTDRTPDISSQGPRLGQDQGWQRPRGLQSLKEQSEVGGNQESPVPEIQEEHISKSLQATPLPSAAKAARRSRSY